MGECNCVGPSQVEIDSNVRLKLPKLHDIQDIMMNVLYVLNLLTIVSIFHTYKTILPYPDKEQPDLMYFLYMCGDIILGRLYIRGW